MSLMKYFGFAGSALVLLLFGLDWLLPQPVSERIRSGTDRSVIRISSAEQLPERVVIDTSLPTIVPPPSALDFAESPPQSTFVEINSGPRSGRNRVVLVFIVFVVLALGTIEVVYHGPIYAWPPSARMT
jgi:hypothetical protein